MTGEFGFPREPLPTRSLSRSGPAGRVFSNSTSLLTKLIPEFPETNNLGSQVRCCCRCCAACAW